MASILLIAIFNGVDEQQNVEKFLHMSDMHLLWAADIILKNSHVFGLALKTIVSLKTNEKQQTTTRNKQKQNHTYLWADSFKYHTNFR